jgi:hypothetical protein
MDSLIAKLYQSTKTILTNKDLALIWQENDKDNLNAKIAYYVKQKALIRLTRGVFAKNKDYNSKELATSLYTPSYISFETVLREAGVIFQHILVFETQVFLVLPKHSACARKMNLVCSNRRACRFANRGHMRWQALYLTHNCKHSCPVVWQRQILAETPWQN